MISAPIKMTKAEWEAEGLRRFGPDVMQWKFKCPSCGYIASVQDWKNAGAEENTVAFSCVGRWTGSKQQLGSKEGGPCNYAGGGLFRLNPVFVDDSELGVFEFAEGKEAA